MIREIAKLNFVGPSVSESWASRCQDRDGERDRAVEPVQQRGRLSAPTARTVSARSSQITQPADGTLTECGVSASVLGVTVSM